MRTICGGYRVAAYPAWGVPARDRVLLVEVKSVYHYFVGVLYNRLERCGAGRGGAASATTASALAVSQISRFVAGAGKANAYD
jgi:hypothetical protein